MGFLVQKKIEQVTLLFGPGCCDVMHTTAIVFVLFHNDKDKFDVVQQQWNVHDLMRTEDGKMKGDVSGAPF